MPAETENRRMGPFELERKLGVGGMGIVYLAKYLKTGQRVAVKVLSPDLMADHKVAKRFEREMAILKKLKHPHIVQYYGGSTSNNQRFYAMELVKGGSLETLIKKKGPVDWEKAVEYGIQIAQALEHAHAAGVIHRDLKPANLLLTSKGVMKLSDFGIARDTQSTALTAAGKTVGTMSYMAPEQITGKHPISAKTDLYALGCVLFEMLSGRTPFLSETAPEMLFKHLDEEPPSIRDHNINVPIWMDKLIHELMEKDPNDRPFDALAVQVKLEEIKQMVDEQMSIAKQTALGGGSATMKEGDAELTKILGGSSKKKKRKRKGERKVPFYEKVWFLGLCLAAVVGLLVWGFWPMSEQERFAELQQPMASLDASDWYGAEPYVKDYLEDFPDGEHVEQVQQWKDRIDMERAETQAERRESMGRDPESQPERLYMEARMFEKFGDRLTARAKYDGMAALFAEDESSRPYVNLARRNSNRISETIGGEGDPASFIKEQIAEADELYFQGEVAQARSRWQSIASLYSNVTEFEPLVKRVRARILDADGTLKAEYVEEDGPGAEVIDETTDRESE
ncbi:MAG: serine/threonine protein kinase [Planctomycetaceae bacterium]|nr:serine/threonine protein kinase [Planctomycetaceae bacterium]